MLAAWCALLTVVVLWPFVEGLVAGFRGQALVLRDMVVPPTMALNDLARGADGPARAVPQDAVLALLSPVIPPPVVVSALMLAAGFAGALGAAGLAGRHGARLPGRFLAATVAPWNPYVAERLLQGHWSVVAAGMLLPLVAWLAAGTGTRDSDRGRPRQRGRRTAVLILVLAVCALTPTGLVLGVVTACTAAGWRRRALVPLGAGALLALPWLVPSLLSAPDTLADSRGAELFAARAEPFVGTPGALAGLGGIWNAQAVPASRASGPAALAGVVLALVAVAVVVVLVRRRMLPGPLRRLVVLAAVAVVVPALAATGPGLALLGGLLETVPGAGLLRDTQKFVVLALPALAVLTGLLPGPLRGRAGAATVVVASCLLVWLQVPALPRDLADLRPVTLDARYAQVADRVGDGRTLLWPPGNYRVIAGRPTLDPLLKMLPGSPVDPGYLVVDGQVVDGDPETVTLLAGLADGTVTVRDLTGHGIDRVVVTGDGAAPVALPDALADLTPTWSDGDWRLFDLR
ncbi:hypothetical protein [Corynebacterium nuruki]|uniref:hypothetical protein n=1 Tax=Corynebacterium nuruki TaxID=1032851 RepID=UPI00024871F6|nr:hypothetical protein [Corynebacterium nuruki]